MGLADDLIADARDLAARGTSENRPSCMRRSISTAYYAVFHMLVDDFVSQWPFADQRPQLGRMFDHKKMREAPVGVADQKNPTPIERSLLKVKTAFQQLQADRHRADYDLSWNIIPSDVSNAITLAESVFVEWRSIREEQLARHYLLSMSGANR